MVLDLQLFIFHWGLDVVLWQGISLPQSQIFQREGLHNPVGGLFLKDSVLGGVFFVWLFLFVHAGIWWWFIFLLWGKCCLLVVLPPTSSQNV